jgi:hypothetical protein
MLCFGSLFFFVSTLMEMISSTVSDFGYSFDDEVSFPMSAVLEDYNSLGMDLQILLSQIDFVDFLMVAANSRKFCPECYVHDNGDLYSRHPNYIEKPVWLLFLGVSAIADVH